MNRVLPNAAPHAHAWANTMRSQGIYHADGCCSQTPPSSCPTVAKSSALPFRAQPRQLGMGGGGCCGNASPGGGAPVGVALRKGGAG